MIDAIFELQEKLSDLEYDVSHFTDVMATCQRWLDENREQPVFIYDAVVERCCVAEGELKNAQRRYFKVALDIEETVISAIRNEIDFGDEGHSSVTQDALLEKLARHHEAAARIRNYIQEDDFPEYGE